MNTKAERTRKKWTKEEDNFLVENWGKIKVDTLCKKLGRTKRAVEERAYNTLRLGHQAQWYTLLEIQYMTGINKDTIRKRIVKTNFKCMRARTKQKPYMLDEFQLKRFLKENQDLWHTKNLTINIFSNEKWYLEKVEADKFKTNKYNKAWSEYEDNIMLDRLSRGFTYEDIAKELNRTAEGVFGRHKYKYRLKL